MYEACCFDYGNTLIEFDLPQIAFIQERFLPELSRRFGPLMPGALAQAMDRLYEMPRLGESPTYLELDPLLQMAILLDDLYGKDSRSREALAAADRALQEIFQGAVAMDPRDRETLRRIAVKVPTVLVSNYPSGDAIRRSLEKVGIAGLFQAVVVSGDVGFVKPHPSMFRAALDAVRRPPAKTLFVGDRWDADICGAREAGLAACHMVGFTSEKGFEEKYRLCRPDHIVRSLEEVAALLGV